MLMEASTYLEILCQEIHSVVIATIDENDLPTTRVIDIMLHDEQGLYFLTAKGKAFYRQLTAKPYIALSGMIGSDGTMTQKAISLSGAVKNIGTKKLDAIFEKNCYMAEIYPSKESQKALEVFCLYKGKGEYFDLSTKPITRNNFAFGGEAVHLLGYRITATCKGCSECQNSCPSECIQTGTPYVINQENCLHCGNCYETCPNDAIINVG